MYVICVIKDPLIEVVFCNYIVWSNERAKWRQLYVLRPFYMGQASDIATKIPKITCELIVGN